VSLYSKSVENNYLAPSNLKPDIEEKKSRKRYEFGVALDRSLKVHMHEILYYFSHFLASFNKRQG
jgi:hypothetical protein